MAVQLKRKRSITDDDVEKRPKTHVFSQNSISQGSKAHFGDVYYGEQDKSNQISVDQCHGNPTSSGFSISSWLASFLKGKLLVAKLRCDLGPWAQEARSSSGQWLIPCLTRGAFREHLLKHDGAFKLDAACLSTFGWAKMLHSLDILPGQNIISWKLPQRGTDLTAWSFPDLLMDGEVACHLINLYGQGGKDRMHRKGHVPPDSDITSNDFSFHHLSFGNIELSRRSRNFNVSIEDIAGGYTGKFDLSLFRSIVKPLSGYLSTFETGISDPACVLPPLSAPIVQRATALVLAMKKLQRSSSGSITFTREWLEGASRIKRRITKPSGNGQTLSEHLTNIFCALLEDKYRLDIITVIAGLAMYEGEAFSSRGRPGPDESWNPFEEHRLLKAKIYPQLASAVGSFGKDSGDEWALQIASMPDTVCEILKMPHIIRGQVLLPFDASHELWNADCRVHA